MATSRWSKFVLLMWKNWLLQWRHKLQTVIEIMVPVVFSALLVLLRGLVDPEIITTDTRYEPIRINSIANLGKKKKSGIFLKLLNNFKRRILPPMIPEIDVDYRLVYSPTNSMLDELVNRTATALRLNGYESTNSSKMLEETLMVTKFIAGIEFDDSLSTATELPKQLSFALRFPSELRTSNRITPNPLLFNWRTDFLFPMFRSGGPRERNHSDGGLPPGYIREGFMGIQNALSTAFTEMKTGFKLPEVFMNRYPYPPYSDDPLLQGLQQFVSIIILLSFVYPCINLVKFITTEKERQLKESMKIMGLPNWLHWTAWFTKSMIFMIISISMIVVLIKVTWYRDSEVSVFTFSDWSVLWVFLFLYSIATTMYCFMMSVFFSRANTATAVAGLVWFMIYAPYTFTEQNYANLSLTSILLVSLLSNSAMAYGFRLILQFEGIGTGITWSNIWETAGPDDQLKLGHILLMLVLDSFLYFVITLYVEQILPGDFGVPQKWYFPFTRTFWCGQPEYAGASNHLKNIPNPAAFEAEPIDKRIGVEVKDLRKVYSNKKVAVDGLTINMFEDQITVLLGHNGAGKTTTMSMLTGMFPPTSGTALVNDKDIRTDIQGVRNSLGLCPQHNILFDELTVREHIIFFSKLKGLESSQDIDKEIEKYVNLLELQPKINTMSMALSGGMQRKLSVGIALCGNSKVVLCDEPTSGMDPAARRALWDLLQKEKMGRTILLSTHFMDEADILGDRIAIMSDGELKACGSSFFLKKKFGDGYHLICVKGADCQVSEVTNILRKYVPNILVETDIGTELSYNLSEEYADDYENMLRDLEANADRFGLLGYGVSLTTLEEVFIKVGTDSQNKETLESRKNGYNVLKTNGVTNGVLNGNGADIETVSIASEDAHDAMPLLRGGRLVANQIIAMFEKKIYNTWRNWILFALQVIIPVIFLVLTILIVRTWAGGSDLPALKISLDKYRDTVTVLSHIESADSPTNDFEQSVALEYQKMFLNVDSKHKFEYIQSGFDDHLLKLGTTLISRINSRYMVGAAVNGERITAWFNNQAYHTAPLSLGILHNAMLRAAGCGADCEIIVTNKPMPYLTESRLTMIQAGNNMGFQLAFNTGFALSFVTAFYILFYIRERVSRAKLLQFVSGVNVLTFWITAFIWDYITFLFTAVCSMCVLAGFQEDGWSSFPELGRVFLLWMVFGYGMLPMTYLMSQFFSIPSTGFVRSTIFNIFSGLATFTIVFIMAFEAFDLQPVSDGLTWGFLFFPHFAISQGISNLNVINTLVDACGRFPDTGGLLCTLIPLCCQTNFFAWEAPGIGRNLVFMFFTGTICFTILLFFELRVFEGIFYAFRNLWRRCLRRAKNLPYPVIDRANIDSDVLVEKDRVTKMDYAEIAQNNLVLKNMTKLYKQFVAVNELSIGVTHSECFGLLGVNGAGKTSTFKMLTGDEKISYGEAWVTGISLKSNMKKVHQRIGYCPQFDALIDDLTGRETLRIFSLLRGIPKQHINGISLKLANELNFIRHIDKKVQEYSGGNKRKLSTAIALLGNPAVVYLDEPTTGMDPGAKRQLWNMICKIRNSGKSIILTSHSMEECEALCTRLAIMVNGEFKCIGSSQYLKNKFSKGYLLSIKIKKPNDDDVDMMNLAENVTKVKLYVATNFPGSLLKEEYQGQLTYSIPSTNMKWSRMFGLMQKSKGELNIEDYSLSQTSLEQVFLSFTKYQKDENKPQ